MGERDDIHHFYNEMIFYSEFYRGHSSKETQEYTRFQRQSRTLDSHFS